MKSSKYPTRHNPTSSDPIEQAPEGPVPRDDTTTKPTPADFSDLPTEDDTQDEPRDPDRHTPEERAFFVSS